MHQGLKHLENRQKKRHDTPLSINAFFLPIFDSKSTVLHNN